MLCPDNDEGFSHRWQSNGHNNFYVQRPVSIKRFRFSIWKRRQLAFAQAAKCRQVSCHDQFAINAEIQLAKRFLPAPCALTNRCSRRANSPNHRWKGVICRFNSAKANCTYGTRFSSNNLRNFASHPTFAINEY